MTKLRIVLLSGLIILILLATAWALAQFTPSSEQPVPPPQIMRVPQIDVQATVVALTEDPNTPCENKCPQTEYPRDTGVLKIERVYRLNETNYGPFETLREGDTLPVTFGYSSRPAKIRRIPSPQESLPPPGVMAPNKAISHTIALETRGPAQKENGYYIFTIENPNATVASETTLTGLSIGTSIRTTVDYTTEALVGQYTIVSKSQ